MHTDFDHSEVRELDQRSGDGFEVTLLWSERNGSVFVCVDDRRTKAHADRQRVHLHELLRRG